MKILAVDTTSIVSTVAVMEEDKLLGEMYLNHKLTHSESLMPMIDSLLKSLELQISDIDFYAVSNGPGSFTGLRIGISAIKGLAYANNKKVVALSTLEALAYNLPFCGCNICTIMDARNNDVYSGIFKFNDGVLGTIHAPCAKSIHEIVEEVAKLGVDTVFIGDGVAVNYDIILDGAAGFAKFAPNNLNLQRASSLAELAFDRLDTAIDAKDVVACYLRVSQAEREKMIKNNL